MWKILIACLFCVSAARLRAQGDVVYSRADSARVVRLLTEASRLPQAPASWTLHFARQFIGTPYVGGTLDRGKEEKLVVNLPELDCTTYVEQVLALARCAQLKSTSFADFCRELRHIRYIDGQVAYTKRQHYFSVWIDDNAAERLVSEVQQPVPPFRATQVVRVHWMTRHVQDYKMLTAHPEWLPGIQRMETNATGKRYRYIPKASVTNTTLLRETIHDGDILAIVTSKDGLDIAHIGFAVWHDDGLHLLNASSIHKRVIDEPMTLRQYLWKSRSRLGIRVIRCLGPS